MKFKMITLLLLCSTFIIGGCSNANTDEMNSKAKEYYNLTSEEESIGNILGQHDVVLLGESVHDSIDIFNKKVDLIKYLVENEGFNLIMLEGSEAELEYYKDRNHPVDEGLNYIYQHENFVEYFFNNQLIETTQIDWLPLVYDYPSFDTLLLDEIHKEISTFDKVSADKFKSAEISLRTWTYEMLSSGKPEEFNREENIYQTLIDENYFSELSKPTQDYIKKKNFNVVNYISEIDFENGYVEYNIMRSKGMANSIKDKLGKNTKAVIWIHNGHAQYEPGKINYDKQTSYDYEENLQSVGTILRNEGLDIYNVGLIFNEAKAGFSPFIQDNIERKSNDEFLEGYIGNQTEDDIFIDLRENYFIKDQIYKLDELGDNEYTMNPHEQYDGLIYIDTIEK